MPLTAAVDVAEAIPRLHPIFGSTARALGGAVSAGTSARVCAGISPPPAAPTGVSCCSAAVFIAVSASIAVSARIDITAEDLLC